LVTSQILSRTILYTIYPLSHQTCKKHDGYVLQYLWMSYWRGLPKKEASRIYHASFLRVLVSSDNSTPLTAQK